MDNNSIGARPSDQAGHERSPSAGSPPVGDHPSRFTPGPWARSRKSNSTYIISEADNGQTVARVTEFVVAHKAEQVANANLISAAPELHDALERLRSVIEAAGVNNLSNGVQLGPIVWAVKCSEALEAAKAVIAKARGESIPA